MYCIYNLYTSKSNKIVRILSALTKYKNSIKHIANFRKENTMQDFLLYRPYRTQRVGAFMTFIPSIILGYVGGWMAIEIHPWTFPTYFMLLAPILGMIVTNNCYNDYSKVIAFGQNEVQVFEKSLVKKYLWSDFSDAYCSLNGWGHLYIILSNCELSSDEVWSVRRKADKTRRKMCLENSLAIYIGNAFNKTEKDLTMIKEELLKHQINLHNLPKYK